MSHLFCTDEVTSLALMKLPKHFSGSAEWTPKGSNAGFIAIQIRPEHRDDDFGGTIAGQLVILEYRIPQRVPRCKYTFTLFQIKGGVQLRAYQLEVVPLTQPSSREQGILIKGPHEHVGNKALALTTGYSEDDFQAWFTLFCSKINLTLTNAIPDPFSLSLTP